jgi:hypothetical protein
MSLLSDEDKNNGINNWNAKKSERNYYDCSANDALT